MNEFLSLANSMADKAGEIIRTHFRSGFDVETKSDLSPVTVADRAVEQALREIIETARPDDGILGEEFGTKESKNGLTWVLDPIDGTKSFVIGRPTFGTLIALAENDIPKLGLIDQPILRERWIGVEGQPTTFNGQTVKTRACKSIDDARICSTTPAMFQTSGPAYEVLDKTGKRLTWGGDCYMYGMLACGWLDIAIEASLSPYDFAALVPIVKGAGGHISDWRGEELTLQSDGRVIAVGDLDLWVFVERLIRKSPY
jgi:inositol-phosphate phosphatase / L-galactose 1-phosphate phosphatase / histidinol-phosphatase